MKGLILSTILSSLLSHGVNTAHSTKLIPSALPDKCPSVTAIASQGLDHISPFLLWGSVSWMGIKENARYDTNDNWTLIGIQSEGDKNGKVAILQMTAQLNSLQVNGGPQIDNDNHVAFCIYTQQGSHLKLDSEFIALAYTPPSYL